MQIRNAMLMLVRNLLLAVVLGLPVAPVSGAENRQSPAYVRLDSWGRSNAFQLRWLKPEKVLQLSNTRDRIVFTVNAAEVQINGVNVWLSFPILFRSGAARISRHDLDNSLSPVLHPPALAAGVKVRTICLDPGHGGSDPGNRTGRNEEQKYTLLLAYEIRDQLNAAGFKVVLTRATDKYVGLGDRTAVARERRADLFLSLHFNATRTSKSKVQGVETYCITPPGAHSTNARGEGNTRAVPGNRHGSRSQLLAYQIQKAMVSKLSAEDRGVRHARFQVLREASMPAVLIEGGFMSHPAEGRRITDPAHRRDLARAIVKGVLGYKKAVNG